jgi:outer membrane protein assembly factor BamB
VLAASCASSAGDAVFSRAGDPADVARALALSKAPAPGPRNQTGRPLVFLVTAAGGRAEGDGITAVALDPGGPRVVWSRALGPADAVAARLEVGRSQLVYGTRDGALVALAIDSGRERWRVKAPGGSTRIGFGADGDDAYVTYRLGGAGEGVLMGIGAGGSVRFRAAFPDRVGAPAARGGLVAVPQRSQFITLVDGASGRPVGDILSREEAATFVQALPEGLFFGSQGVFHASVENAVASRKGPGYVSARMPPFVRPVYSHDTYKPAQSAYSALDRNRLVWRPQLAGGAAGGLGFAAGQVVVLNFRFLFALDATAGGLRWAYSHAHDVAGAAHTGRALLFADQSGQVGALDPANGRLQMLAMPAGFAGGTSSVIGAAFDADGFSGAGPGAGPAPSAAEVLTSIVLDPDRRFTDVRLFAVEQLGGLKTPGVSRALLSILEGAAEHPEVARRAGDLLVARQDADAAAAFHEAVKVVPDYALSRRPQRLDLMARALAQLNARDAVPALVEHLRLPETDPEAAGEIARAVMELEAREHLGPLRDYLAAYRADAFFASQPGALIAAAETLLRLGGPPDRAFLFFVAEEPKTLDAVRVALERMLAETSGSPSGQPNAEETARGKK